MNLKQFTKRITAMLLALLTLLSFNTVYAQDSGDEEAFKIDRANRVYFYNMGGGGSVSSDFILVESKGHFGLIDSGHRYENTIADSDETVYSTFQIDGLSCQIRNKNGRDAMQYFIDALGIEHLDFIIGTHAHSDHIGGIPEIAELTVNGKNGESKYLVDENTVYFYKNYHHINDANDDLAAKSPESWHSQAFAYQAQKAMESRGAVMAELSRGAFVSNAVQSYLDYNGLISSVNATSGLSEANYSNTNTANYFDDYFAFTFGDFTIRLYNLFAHKSTIDENVNSIVTVISDGINNVACLADINVENKTEQKLAKEIAEDVGTISVLKVAHHGAGAGSNSKEMIDLFKPLYAVATRRINTSYSTNASGGYSAVLYYARLKYKTVFYETGYSDYAVAFELSDNGVAISNMAGVGSEAHLESAEKCVCNLVPENGWSAWNVQWGTQYLSDYYYFVNGSPHTNWLKDGQYWYYFAKDGFMKKGWANIGGATYYFATSGDKSPIGAMLTGWQLINSKHYFFSNDGKLLKGWQKIAGKWYYLATDGAMRLYWQKIGGKWYYFYSNGEMATGWCKLGNRWYYLNSDGSMATGWKKLGSKWYYLNPSGAMATGWKKVGSVWYYFNSSGYMKTGWLKLGGKWYYLNSSGAMVTGSRRIGRKTYRFNSSGVCLNP